MTNMQSKSNPLDTIREQKGQLILQASVDLCRSYDEYRYAWCIILLSLLFINAVEPAPVGRVSRVAGGNLNVAPSTPNVLPAGQLAVSVVFSKRTFLRRSLLGDGRSECGNNFFVKS